MIRQGLQASCSEGGANPRGREVGFGVESKLLLPQSERKDGRGAPGEIWPD